MTRRGAAWKDRVWPGRAVVVRRGWVWLVAAQVWRGEARSGGVRPGQGRAVNMAQSGTSRRGEPWRGGQGAAGLGLARQSKARRGRARRG